MPSPRRYVTISSYTQKMSRGSATIRSTGMTRARTMKVTRLLNYYLFRFSLLNTIRNSMTDQHQMLYDRIHVDFEINHQPHRNRIARSHRSLLYHNRLHRERNQRTPINHSSISSSISIPSRRHTFTMLIVVKSIVLDSGSPRSSVHATRVNT